VLRGCTANCSNPFADFFSSLAERSLYNNTPGLGDRSTPSSVLEGVALIGSDGIGGAVIKVGETLGPKAAGLIGRLRAAGLIGRLFAGGGVAKAVQAVGAIVPRGARSLGQWGETRLAGELGGAGAKPSSPFVTSLGRRYIDRLVNGMAYEAKAGLNVGLTSGIRRQALKDAELIATGQIRGAEWHFFQGAKPELLQFLRQQGIESVVHP
jgi:hypothetical protein